MAILIDQQDVAAILRLVEETPEGDVIVDEPAADVDAAPAEDRTDGIESIKVETPEETKARLERNDEN